ncbi:gluconate 2-dehydrogenase subunit 3 family protein [Mycobacterium sp. smrl_JER01]|uniref:gluconate 2-dehydrogenase subunit 3 family protein n=1 Tax=Mycobacterium sp. smrl_JER01 TaxID=3402633 RepID=UPI003AC37A85
MTTVNVQLTGAPGKPPLGGWVPQVEFDTATTMLLNALADTLIPPGGGYPAPSAVDIVGFFRRYVTPSGQEARWYPFVSVDHIACVAEWLGADFTRSDEAARVTAVAQLEREHVEEFSRLRDLVYHAYYSRPAVISAINAQSPAGRDYRISPQPYGYADTIDDWDEELLSRVQGTYQCTEDVVRVALPDTLAGPNETVESAWLIQGGTAPFDADSTVDALRVASSGTP